MMGKGLIKYMMLLILFSLFFVIRAFQDQLFYDPLIAYYQNDYLYTTPPDVELPRYFFHLAGRYFLNTIISLAILGLLFRDHQILRFSGYFFGIAFVVLSLIFGILLVTQFSVGYLLPFYVRRFIIHPLLLFLLLPIFYYYKKS